MLGMEKESKHQLLEDFQIHSKTEQGFERRPSWCWILACCEPKNIQNVNTDDATA